jgi:(1->4)-alpha-D-glucan 1-alpha-D-glucosylmutase
MMTGTAPRHPIATYRLQLGADLTFDDAAALVPYLRALGISDCYTSPFFQTASESSHGYDVSDHNRLRAELGGEEAFARFAEALRREAMGLLIDVVPNHMGIAGNRNPLWWDVLENGPASRFAPFFDIDWAPVKRELADKVLLPILGEQYGSALDGGRLELRLGDGCFTVHYDDTALPVAPRSYARILSHDIETLQRRLGSEHAALLELKTLTTWFVTLPERTETDPERLAARVRDKTLGCQRLTALLAASAEVREFVEASIRLFNGTPGEPASYDLLDGLLGDQAYRLAFWRVAGEEINYRRFFDINELAAIHMERPDVFEEAHRLIFRLVRDGIVTGLRIDHPDGLYAPAEYLERLQAGAGRPLYVVVEKILAPGEPLPANWQAAGTTGYEFMNLLNGIFVDRTQARLVDDLYRRLLRERVSFPEIVYEAKRLIMDSSMASEIAMLAHRLNLMSEKHRTTRDFTLGVLGRALVEIIAAFPVYRTYVGDGAAEPSERDQEYLGRAVTQAKERTPATDPSIYDWIHELMLGRHPAWATEADRAERDDWRMRFQQMTGPITAKGYEDTALYRYHRLVSLNDVGSDPARFGTPLNEFHAAMQARQRDAAGALSATSTHDTKRSEDVRARINVLSEIPRLWRQRVGRWQRLNRRHRTVAGGRPVPEPAEEYLIYQTLVGAWPMSADRLTAYVLKAAREAKQHTSWITQNPRYEEALTAFAQAILDRRRSREFLRDLAAFQARVAHFGAFNALAQTLVKITAPGVPDFYQGTELWDLSLVDPDNRRPVDYDARRRLLDGLVAQIDAAHDLTSLARHLVKTKEDGRIKLYLMRQALACRGRHAVLFQEGEYLPLEVAGPLAEHVCAFARVRAAEAALVVVPRLLARRGIDDPPLGAPYWGAETSVALPAGAGRRFRNVLTGEALGADEDRLGLERLLAAFPVALLTRED